MENLQLSVKPRNATSKGELRRLRKSGEVPGIVYGVNSSGKIVTEIVQVSAKELAKNINNPDFYSQIVTLVHESGKSERAILRELQRHPWKNSQVHIDFMRVDDAKKLKIKVPFRFLHEDKCIGVRLGGGSINHLMSDVELFCLPKDIPRFLTIDLENMQVGQSLHLSDIQLPDEVSYSFSLSDEGADRAVVSVTIRQVETEASTVTALAEATPVEGAAETKAADAKAPEAKPAKK
ncbi:MAG: 50S ribosomal protein L25/general stress protein Ctc [Methylacidiphilales bacterium]|nr:50S ribosomal protein L25/general stress protein Ctc [Candidatus Methylacidiphilales bacterium]